jgi:glycine/D-amino acid oxidase-like deaminating enzyme
MTGPSSLSRPRERCPMLIETGDLEAPATVLEGSHDADICIVGGGYLGLWTAIELQRAEPNMSIAVVEADICGGGASGRNSGMALAYWPKIQALVHKCGVNQALWLCEESVRAIDDIELFGKSHGIDLEFTRTGWLWGATCRRQEGRWVPILEVLSGHGKEPFRVLDGGDVAAMVEAPGFHCGVYDATAATIQPAKLARGLRQVALDAGVQIFEHSPMARLRRTLPAVVCTPRGQVRAARVILAMNAWSLALPELRRGIFVITSDDAITEPATPFLEQRRWLGGPIVTDSGVFVSGYRPTRDGRIVGGVTGGAIGFGSLRRQRFEGPTPRVGDIAAAFRRSFGGHASVRFVASWRGPIDRTRSGLPVFGQLPKQPNVLFGYGFSGNGIVGSRIGSKILASLALERNDAWATSGLVSDVDRWMPPEPIRFIGAHMVRSAVRHRDHADQEDRDIGPIARMLASQAPGGIVTTRSA